MDGLERLEDVGSTFGANGLGMDGVAVVVIENKDLGVSSAGGNGKTSGLVCENGAVVGEACGIAAMSGGVEGGRVVVVVVGGSSGG